MTDDTTDTTSADDQFLTDSSAVIGEGRRIGKTTRHVEAMAAVSAYGEMETERVDPKDTREGGENGG